MTITFRHPIVPAGNVPGFFVDHGYGGWQKPTSGGLVTLAPSVEVAGGRDGEEATLRNHELLDHDSQLRGQAHKAWRSIVLIWLHDQLSQQP